MPSLDFFQVLFANYALAACGASTNKHLEY